jgi:hypothetical protein
VSRDSTKEEDMSEAVMVYSFDILAGETFQLWIHGYDQGTYVGFDLKPELVVNQEKGGRPEFTGEKLFLAYHLVGVGEHVDTTIGYTLSFTSQSSGVDVEDMSGFLINLFEPISNFPA